MSEFVSAYRGAGRTIVYEDEEGARLIKREGSPAWRNNNPGNIEQGNFAKSKGPIGSDGRFAVFPNRDSGKGALKALLETESYNRLTVGEAMNRYAPSHENDTDGYTSYIEKSTGIPKDKNMDDLTEEEKDRFADSIEAFEGSIEGEMVAIPKQKPDFDATGRMIRY